MVSNKANSVNETKTKKTAAKQVKTTKGEINSFNNITWNYMLKQLKIPQDQLITLSGAVCPAKVSGIAATVVRIFNPEVAKGKGITVENYESFNAHPELILYDGYYVRGKGGEVILKKREDGQTSFLEEKIKNGTITEVGVVIPKTGAAKWLSRFGTFMMMGGFLVVLIGGVVIVIAISLLTKSC
jgi:hypothetical protein